MSRIKVAVSPFYRGEDWTDELTGITFRRDDKGMTIYSIPKNLDLTNIKKAIRLNTLILVEGELEDLTKEEAVEEKKEEVIEAKEEKTESLASGKEEKPKAKAKRSKGKK